MFMLKPRPTPCLQNVVRSLQIFNKETDSDFLFNIVYLPNSNMYFITTQKLLTITITVEG